MLADPRLRSAAQRLGRPLVKAAIRSAQQAVRSGEIAAEAAIPTALAALPARATTLRPVYNATGVVLHTNLGRAPLSAAAIEAMVVAAGHTDVELDLATGRRARRGRGTVDALAQSVPEAEAVHVVNNGAAALVLAATALAADREILLSRGEFVEIGNGFRIPELLASTGARVREVGTTNRTSTQDYADALGPHTGFILKIHPSNFVIKGFTSEAPVSALAALGVPVVVDIGSGLLRPEPMLPDEPDAATALRAGATLVTASGDKLLGGPQAGLLLGRDATVQALRRHPLARALRVDKLTLAALEATLRGPETPVWQALRQPLTALEARCGDLVDRLAGRGVTAEVVACDAVVGGGGAPGVAVPSCAVSLPAQWGVRLREGNPAVVGRVVRQRLLLDLRCVPPPCDDEILSAVLRVAGD
jgi:L-seryl-tRNA(Ser) seleniumtransferase